MYRKYICAFAQSERVNLMTIVQLIFARLLMRFHQASQFHKFFHIQQAYIVPKNVF
jgi:hypothetical protein